MSASSLGSVRKNTAKKVGSCGRTAKISAKKAQLPNLKLLEHEINQ